MTDSHPNVSRETIPDGSSRERFLSATNVSRETLAKLDRYAEMLVEWNQRFNLVASSTIPHLWERHFLDSWQLLGHIPIPAPIIADIGSGAGFPGLILAIMGAGDIHLIESTGKKANFLRAVASELGLTASIHQKRVEDIEGLQADIVTALAVAALPDLFPLATRLSKRGAQFLFLKGKNVGDEIEAARKNWSFTFDKHPSISDDSGVVLTIRDLKNNGSRNIRRKNP